LLRRLRELGGPGRLLGRLRELRRPGRLLGRLRQLAVGETRLVGVSSLGGLGIHDVAPLDGGVVDAVGGVADRGDVVAAEGRERSRQGASNEQDAHGKEGRGELHLGWESGAMGAGQGEGVNSKAQPVGMGSMHSPKGDRAVYMHDPPPRIREPDSLIEASCDVLETR